MPLQDPTQPLTPDGEIQKKRFPGRLTVLFSAIALTASLTTTLWVNQALAVQAPVTQNGTPIAVASSFGLTAINQFQAGADTLLTFQKIAGPFINALSPKVSHTDTYAWKHKAIKGVNKVGFSLAALDSQLEQLDKAKAVAEKMNANAEQMDTAMNGEKGAETLKLTEAGSTEGAKSAKLIDAEFAIPDSKYNNNDPMRPIFEDLVTETTAAPPPPDPLKDVLFTGYVDAPNKKEKVALLRVKDKTLVKRAGDRFSSEDNEVLIQSISKNDMTVLVNGEKRTIDLQPYVDTVANKPAAGAGNIPAIPGLPSGAGAAAASGETPSVNEILQQLEN